MCFRYKQKQYGKLSLVILALIVLILAGCSIFGGVYAVLHMNHWAKYIIVSFAGLVGLFLVTWGILMIIIACSMSGRKRSVRDVNDTKGVEDVRLCDFCGRVISKSAVVCEHCGAKQQTGRGMKICPECKTKNSATASYCEKCGRKFEE